MTELEQIAAKEGEHLIQSYGRYQLLVERGKGCYVYDAERKRYLDFITGIGVTALGHAHPRLTKVMREQMGKLVHCSNLYYHPYQSAVASKLAEMSGLPRAFFCNSGAEAVELAFKMAKGWGRRQSPDKYEVVALNNSFAGRTTGAVALTGQAKFREPWQPLIPGVKFIDVNDVSALEAVVGPNTAAIFFEPILGEGGIIEVGRPFAKRAAELAKEHNALLVLDEIQCGLGRSGAYFAFQAWHKPGDGESEGIAIHPDIVTVAKPLAGGLPLGAVLANNRAAELIAPGTHGSTFGGGPLACRTALEFLEVMDELLPMIREHGVYLQRRLDELTMKYDFVVGPRGRGLMVGLELTESGKGVVPKAQELGLLMNCTADKILRFLPPYIIERKHIDQAYDILDTIFADGIPS